MMRIAWPSFNQASVLIVGDIMLDKYCHGHANRISPEAPVPVVTIDTSEERPGGAANVAVNVAALGCKSHLIGLIGIDESACALKAKLVALEVNHNLITINNHPTITKLRVLSRNQQLMRLDFEQKYNDAESALLIEPIQQALQQTGILVLSDYAKGTLSCVRDIITLAHNYRVPVLIDPKGADFNRYRGATIITPNLSEFEVVAGQCKDKTTLINRGMKIISEYGFSALLITQSEYGMTLLRRDREPLHLPAQARKAFDVTGAGDTVIGVLAAALAAGNNLEESCFLANTAAGIVVSKLGTSNINLVELKHAIYKDNKITFGSISEFELKQCLILARKRGEKIVMTNGVFDIVHAGHVNYLTSARSLGDRLIVAVNSDNSARRLKGKDRPINTLNHRIAVLLALKSVDWVVSFNEDTPQRLIAELLPDVLVKGGDYNPNQIIGSQEVLSNGGNVLVLDFKENCCTTNIINSIKKFYND